MKIINFFRSKDGNFEYATCDNGNVYRRYTKRWHGSWSKWELWVDCENIEHETRETSDGIRFLNRLNTIKEDIKKEAVN